MTFNKLVAKICLLSVATLLTAPFGASAGWFEPSSYEECEKEAIEEAQSQKNLEFLKLKCHEKFWWTPEAEKKKKRIEESAKRQSFVPINSSPLKGVELVCKVSAFSFNGSQQRVLTCEKSILRQVYAIRVKALFESGETKYIELENSLSRDTNTGYDIANFYWGDIVSYDNSPLRETKIKKLFKETIEVKLLPR